MNVIENPSLSHDRSGPIGSLAARLKSVDKVWALTILSLIALSASAFVYQLASGQISDFYGSIAMSMSKNLNNFWFGASDPGGTITLDKIPGSYWIPAIFVKLFGFSVLSVTLPNALASMGLVLVVAATGRRLGGRTAGLISGAIAATTPILAAVARSNQPESFFLLALAIASYFGVRAVQDSSFKHLMWSGVWIAIAFHMYMLVAWALWPALGVAYLFTRGGFRVGALKKVGHILAAGLTSLALSFVWIFSVMFTPASNRPYIGGSNTNSALEMVFGYNGLGRFSTLTSGTELSSAVRSFTPPFSGEPGLFRLLNGQLLPQIGWLVPSTLAAILVLIILKKFNATAIFVSLFFLVYAAMFSVVSGMHQFYTAALAIPMALFISLAMATAGKAKAVWGQILIVAMAAVISLYIAVNYLDYFVWSVGVQFALAIVAVILLVLGVRGRLKWVLPLALTGALTASPAIWALDTFNHPSSINPVAGAANSGFGGMGMGGGFPAGGFPAGGFPTNGLPGGGSFGGPAANGGPGLGSGLDSGALAYLQENRAGAKYLLAVFGTMTAAPMINATGENILPIGGFDGSDPAPSFAQFKALVAAGDIRFVMTGGGNMNRGLGSGSATSVGQSNTSQIQSWVLANCAIADYSGNSNSTLYRCSPTSVN